MYRTPVTKPVVRLPDINTGKPRSEMKIVVEHIQGSRVGKIWKSIFYHIKIISNLIVLVFQEIYTKRTACVL